MNFMMLQLNSKRRWFYLAALLACSSMVVKAHEGHDDPVEAVDEAVEDVLPEESVEDKKPVLKPFKPSSIVAPFFEQFLDDWDKTWIVSETKKTVDGVEDEDLLRYRGTWNVEVPSVWPGFLGDQALVVKTPAAHHAISAKLKNPIDPSGKDLVIQYEVKFQKNHECGGAYMKLLTFNESFDPKAFEDKTPYTLMFGPDKCGFNNKVHFIFRHKNPITGEYEEKHMDNPPSAKIEKTTSLYTLIVRPDNTFDLLINNEKVKSGSLLKDFTPAVNPPEEIDDPEDKKPSDWVDDAKISDPDAKKPDDWDEDAPAEIEDVDAVKPADWLDNEPLTIPDPEAQKPEDWDDEEDGDWIAAPVSNPKCAQVSGCGEWKRPMKKNPNYKAPMIDNPAYKGVWKPRKIANPKFFKDLNPSKFEKIGAVGYELWTINDGITFDNIYVGHSVEDAKKIATEQWAVKFATEKQYEAVENVKTDSQENKKTGGFVEQLNTYKNKVVDDLIMFAEKVKISPVDAIKEHVVLVSGLTAAIVVLVSMIMALFSGSPRPNKFDKAKKEDTPETDDEHETDEKEEAMKEEKEQVQVTKRKTKKVDE